MKITSSSITLEDLLKEKYIIPEYQRPYSWGEEHLLRFYNDICDSYKNKSPIFLGTIQIKKEEKDNIINNIIIDGQQRITTCLLLLKALGGDSGDILSTKVGSCYQEELSNILSNKNKNEDINPTNVYQINYNILNNLSEDKNLNKQELLNFLLENVLFVQISIEADIATTLKIFDTINTAGLPLNIEDLFKIRCHDYLKSYDNDIEFSKINDIYEDVKKANIDEKSNIFSVKELLEFYKYYLILKHELGFEYWQCSASKFFDSLFKKELRKEECLIKECLINLEEIDKIFKQRISLYKQIKDEYSDNYDELLSWYLIYWSRYDKYWWLPIVMKSLDINEERRKEILSYFSKLFLVASVNYAKSIYEIHRSIYNTLINEYEYKSRDSENNVNTGEKFEGELKLGDFYKNLKENLAGYSTPKKLVCRLLEVLEPKQDPNSKLKLKDVFFDGYDIEHIQSYTDCINPEEVLKKWRGEINGIGNLMLLEYDINRRIQNIEFSKKISEYKKSKFSIAKKIAEKKEWNKTIAEEKWEDDCKKLANFLGVDFSAS